MREANPTSVISNTSVGLRTKVSIKHMASRGSGLVWILLSYLILIIVWTAAAILIGNIVLLPSFFATVASLFDLLADGTLLNDVLASIQRVLVGFGIAAVTAVPTAILMSFFPVARKLMMPIIQLLRPIPPIAWIPLAILWFGLGNPPSYFITSIAAFFPIFLNSFQGGLSVQDHHLHAAKFLGADSRALILTIVLPSAMPFIWTGIMVGLGQSWMAVVTAELIAAQSGLGYMIQANRINLETANVLVGMLTIGILGSLMTIGLKALERFVLPWKHN